ncbi:glutaconate CoA-transferase subunit B [Paraburkholderia sp. GAS199]|uniref:CoA-transferase n=1 Tax=Paraburkholderia sp. GAS199 TaxID=3035126 RepID=UPI003D20E5A3
MTTDYTLQELLATVIARIAADAESIGVGNTSPIPAAAALAVYARRNAEMTLSILGSFKYNKLFTGGIREQYDFAARGQLDVQFFGGGQIDGQGNINLVGVDGYPQSRVRLAGSFGSGLQYYTGRRTILFRQEHSRRVLVPKVDFISAPGVSPPNVHRLGGPIALVTGMCLMSFDRERARFTLESVHPGHTRQDVLDETGFEFDCPADVPTTPAPTADELDVLRGFVRREVAEVYPNFAATAFLDSAPARTTASA